MIWSNFLKSLTSLKVSKWAINCIKVTLVSFFLFAFWCFIRPNFTKISWVKCCLYPLLSSYIQKIGNWNINSAKRSTNIKFGVAYISFDNHHVVIMFFFFFFGCVCSEWRRDHFLRDEWNLPLAILWSPRFVSEFNHFINELCQSSRWVVSKVDEHSICCILLQRRIHTDMFFYFL